MSAAVPLLGLVLAGGESRRMGTDKAALQIAGISLLDRAVRLLQQELELCFVSARPAQADDELRARFTLIEDRLQDIGPAAGMLAAHEHNPAAAWLVVAVDMPLLDADLLASLIASRDPSQDATAWLAEDGQGAEPLCAIYEPGTLARFSEHVARNGDSSPRAWLAKARTRLLKPSREGLLQGANTRQEFASVAERLNAAAGSVGGKNND